MDKLEAKYTNIDEYIATFPEEVQVKLEELRKLVKKLVPNAEEAIRYGIATFRLNGKNFFHFGAFKSHISVFPFPSGVDEFKQFSDEYETATGTIKFPLTKPIPFEIVEKIINYRARENTERTVKGGY
jgi:uncharacterized protein YdhG (YjbR/CyaY superfamily)